MMWVLLPARLLKQAVGLVIGAGIPPAMVQGLLNPSATQPCALALLCPDPLLFS